MGANLCELLASKFSFSQFLMRPGCIEGWQVVQNVELIVRDYHVCKIVLATSIDLFLCQIE